MNYVFIPIFFLILLLTDWFSVRQHMTKAERLVYLSLAILAILSAFPAAHRMQIDHGGASLSSALTLFIS